MLEELSEHPVELLKPDPSAVNLTVLRGQQSLVFPSQFEADRTREAVRPTAHHPKQLLPCTDHFPFQLLILRERKRCLAALLCSANRSSAFAGPLGATMTLAHACAGMSVLLRQTKGQVGTLKPQNYRRTVFSTVQTGQDN